MPKKWEPAPRGANLEGRVEEPGEDANTDQPTVVIDAPTLGLWRGSFGMAIVGPLIVAVPFVILMRGGVGFGQVALGIQVWLITLALVGLVIAAIGTDLGTARTTVSAGPEGFRSLRRSRFRTVTRQAPAHRIESVDIIEAPVTAGNKPLLRLQVSIKDEKPVRIFAGRSEIELNWARGWLNRALSLKG
ncbi:MAG: hypothetical protein AAF797_09740 [Planctomycetota bacterium]